jgi:hypothetical protein
MITSSLIFAGCWSDISQIRKPSLTRVYLPSWYSCGRDQEIAKRDGEKTDYCSGSRETAVIARP